MTPGVSRGLKPEPASFRFYQVLNDFLAPANCRRTPEYRCDGKPAIKDPIETRGLPRGITPISDAPELGGAVHFFPRWNTENRALILYYTNQRNEFLGSIWIS